MAECILLKGGGGGIDPDELTATAAQVLAGYKAGVKGNDEPVSGTMTNQGAKTTSLNCGGSYTIPAGYHNGAGKVTANSLASQTGGTATAAYISNGKTAWVNGSKLTGTLATQGGSTTTPGTANKTIVTAQKHVTGNIIVAGNGNLKAANIKKNVTIFGVKGTFEGWVPVATDLYYNGQNPAGFTGISGYGTTNFENTRIKLAAKTTTGIQTSKTYDVRSFTKLNIYGALLYKVTSWDNIGIHITSYNDITNTICGGYYDSHWTVDDNNNISQMTFSVDITQLISLNGFAIRFSHINDVSGKSYITRIWFS